MPGGPPQGPPPRGMPMPGQGPEYSHNPSQQGQQPGNQQRPPQFMPPGIAPQMGMGGPPRFIPPPQQFQQQPQQFQPQQFQPQQHGMMGPGGPMGRGYPMPQHGQGPMGPAGGMPVFVPPGGRGGGLPGPVPAAAAPAVVGDPNNDVASWSEHDAEDKRKYWYNRVTGTSTYDKPFCLKTPEERSIPPCKWKEYTASDGKKYYSDGKESR